MIDISALVNTGGIEREEGTVVYYTYTMLQGMGRWVDGGWTEGEGEEGERMKGKRGGWIEGDGGRGERRWEGGEDERRCRQYY